MRRRAAGAATSSGEAARRAAWPAAEKLTAGYCRSDDQLRRGILTEDELDAGRFVDEVAIDPGTVAERIAALHDEIGFGNFMLVTGFLGNLPQEQVVRTLELFAREVRPRLRPTPEPSPSGSLP
jgi:alkanesulfonate monooxygenase SsuD/methylene tetrahydromethanopterin reductase-like flavin-dependent oxidoreductase (luciferase family)